MRRKPVDTVAALAEIIAAHSKDSWGMSPNTPDKCTCGAEVYPADAYSDPREHEDISVRRNRAFGQHVAVHVGRYLFQ